MENIGAGRGSVNDARRAVPKEAIGLSSIPLGRSLQFVKLLNYNACVA